ncbi:oxidoreductase [Apiospora saccharicola]|uniref:Oxidoreductase n=1 Tax=Apiospora saccharicola TaxID=335842 RepID=A0ABR1U3G2_9PEZI
MGSEAPSNMAAVLPTAKAHPLVTKAADVPRATDGEIVVKVEAIAINPMDWLIQDMGPDLFPFLQYPYIGGTDVAGQVTEVGSGNNLTGIKVGDRVLGLTLGLTSNDPREGAFQQYVVLKSHMASIIPPALPSTDAAVLPLGIATAAAALYQKDYLGLVLPSLSPEPRGETLLIWAGSSSVGSNAIQLAVASGYEVITTSSPRNFGFCKELGASHVFDYSSASLTEDLVAAFKGKQIAGAFALLPGSAEPCLEVVHKSEGAKFVAMCLPYDGKLPHDVKTKFVFATSIKDNEVSKIIFSSYLPRALEQGRYRCAPAPSVVGAGLEVLQKGMDQQKQGVSAKKLVVTL